MRRGLEIRERKRREGKEEGSGGRGKEGRTGI
jgi:hypothetical protein